MKHNSKQQGFTLIELIVVIVILGILAVTAAPKFINFTSDARAATMNGLRTSLIGATQLVYAKSAIEGEESAPTGAADGINTVLGYPKGAAVDLNAAAGIASTTTGASEFTHIEGTGGNLGTVWYYPASIYAATGTLAEATVEAGDCFVKYIESQAAGTKPAITTTTTGCAS